MSDAPRTVAALFDTHGNLPALDAVLAELAAEPPDLVVFGGDTVNGPFPRETVERLRGLELPAVHLRGNGERELLDGADPWGAAQLDEDGRRFVESFEPSVTLDVAGIGRVLLCHAAPGDDEQIVTPRTPEDVLTRIYGDLGVDVVLLGHTHVRLDRTVGGVRIVGPGSVGWPYADEPGAYWALLAGGRIELRHTPYDLPAAAAAIARSEWPLAEEFARENVEQVPTAAEATDVFEAQREARG
jgi:putative phosphoesterase